MFIEQLMRETCISIEGINHTGQYSYGQIRCKDEKSVYVQHIWFDNERNCEYETSQTKEIFNERLLISCDSISLCKVPFYRSYVNRNYKYLNLRFQCTGDSNIPDDAIRTESHCGPNYAVIVGGIVGVLLIICIIIVGIFFFRRRKCSASGNAQKPSKVMTNSNPTYDPTHGQPEPDNNQQAHLMNSPDAIQVSTSHAVDNMANEESITYSHLRTTVDDSDVKYDHTVRHIVHDTCDGDYDIAHNRITEDDYDVSGNYRQ